MDNITIVRLRIGRSQNPDVYGGEDHLAILEDRRGIVIADIETTPEAEAYANLFATAPELLQIAESAAASFEERIFSLRQELLEDFCDAHDIQDQIGNYERLLHRHLAVIAAAKRPSA